LDFHVSRLVRGLFLTTERVQVRFLDECIDDRLSSDVSPTYIALENWFLVATIKRVVP